MEIKDKSDKKNKNKNNNKSNKNSKNIFYEKNFHEKSFYENNFYENNFYHKNATNSNNGRIEPIGNLNTKNAVYAVLHDLPLNKIVQTSHCGHSGQYRGKLINKW